MKKLIQTLAKVFAFAGIVAGCIALVLLALILIRFPPLLIALLLAYWVSHMVVVRTEA